jgi:hypothetical protein
VNRSSARRLVAIALTGPLIVACGDDGDGVAGPEWVADIALAVEAVEQDLGGPQEFFEVTATPQLTNVFVAADDASSAVPYLYVDDVLEPPGLPLTGASGNTFAADAIDVDEDRVLSRIAEELPNATIDALSVEGGPGGSVRYVASVRSEAGGVLDVVVAADGEILSVTAL